MKKYPVIIMPYGTLRQLRALCKRSLPCIKKALDGYVTKIEHLQIRKQALLLGGVEQSEQVTEKEAHNDYTN
ncbi:MAG: hypothetical protein II939_04050 [Bacteroidales bacterium]|nr:hypothetical protein [Bacteroidales bacterium]